MDKSIKIGISSQADDRAFKTLSRSLADLKKVSDTLNRQL